MENGKRIGLALSGGGYRAAAYHIGTLRALHKLNLLNNIDVISSVSGGSIIAAYYMLHKHEGYDAFENQFIKKLGKGVILTSYLWVALIVVLGIIAYCIVSDSLHVYLTVLLVVILVCAWYVIFPLSCFVEYGYKKNFFSKSTFGMIPDHPVLAINATDLTTGNLFTFSQSNAYCYPYDKANNGKPSFCTCSMHLSRAVMASSCVPQFFTPIKIESSFNRNPAFPFRPLLVDGGLYDNQGAHKFEGMDKVFQVDCAIVSDAGQTYKPSFSCNVIGVLLSSIDVMMRRIKSFQRQHNNYILVPKKVIYAYNDLGWNDYEAFVDRFVCNIKDGYVSEDIYALHGISTELVKRLQSVEKGISRMAFEECSELIAKNINWKDLLERKPKNWDVAHKVKTNLSSLSKGQIDALVCHSEWMTEVQVRLHLPFLLSN